MCGILGLIGNDKTIIDEETRKKYLELSKLIRHRGPDWNGIYINEEQRVIIAHERLSIVGVENGSQPLIDETGNIILSINGEIYNYKQLYETIIQGKYIPKTKSDCEIILYLYQEFGKECVKMLDGIFSFIIYDKINNDFLVARDPIGITPLFYGITQNDEILFASEVKSIQSECIEVHAFPPGHYMTSSRELVKYYNPRWLNSGYSLNNETDLIAKNINTQLTKAISKRLMADVPFGVLLSGGLDSSLIASVTSRLMRENSDYTWGNKLHSFSIGLPGAPDLKAAANVAKFLGTIHHEFNFSIQEGLDALQDVIYHLETYDITTIRASTPMYLLSRKIKAMGIKMVLSGEGADEVFGGYLYFHKAPSEESFHEECVNRVNGLHYFDCLRANKSTMAWGLEARTPFLDKTFLEHAMPIRPDIKRGSRNVGDTPIEKYILRKAFDTPDDPYLPDEILWRQKEQFSDGVGYSWIDQIIVHANNNISDEEFATVSTKYPINTPRNKEALFFRKIFDRLFPGRDELVPKWVPRTDWDGVNEDPSGRAQDVHNDTIVTN
jgi:asparagine synthase (glutamine-hydrolysing)